MRIDDLTPAYGARQSYKRLGRGIGSGKGKTSGKGHKGQWARSGGGVRPGFEGGQMPLSRRIPKSGFDNSFKAVYSIVNVCDLEQFDDGAVVNIALLLESRVLRKEEPYGVKVLGNGKLTKKLTVQAKKFSKSAQKSIVDAGGKVEVL